MNPLTYLAQVESNARTYAASFPRMFIKSQGVTITDSEGQEYLDCLSNAGTLALGHNHPEIKEAVAQFLESDPLQQALDLATPAKYDFVTELFSLLPGYFQESGRVLFCGPTGADAVEAAIKLAKYNTGRQNVIAFQGGYHGMTAGALSAMGNLFPKTGIALTGVHFMPYPYSFRCPFGTDGTTTDSLSINYIKSVLSDPEGGVTKPAAVIVEIVQGEGGCIPASVEWLRELRDVTRDQDIILIVDEVQTGLGRTGRTFAIEHAGILPDIMVLSKAIGGGYPLSMIIYDKRLDTWPSGMHVATFRGNQIAMVAGRATMRVVNRESLDSHADVAGQQLISGLKTLAKRFSFLGDIRGRGLMIGVEIVQPDSKSTPPPTNGSLARKISQRCFEEGLIIDRAGRDGSVLRFLPPLVISKKEVDTVLDRFEAAVKKANSNQSAWES